MLKTSSTKQAVQRAREILANYPIFLDTETTGLHRDAEIVEIAIVDMEGEVLFESLVKPRHPIPPDAEQIHHINDAMVAKAPPWPFIWSEVLNILKNHQIGIYNADFDLRMIKNSLKMYQMDWNGFANTHCIMKLYSQYQGEWNPKYRAYRFHSLEKAARQCKITIENTHRAREDALLARAVLMHMANTAT